MTESTIGSYPAWVMDDAAPTPLQIFQTSESDAGTLKAYSPFEAEAYNLFFLAGAVEGQFPDRTTENAGTLTESAAGVTFDTTNVASDRIAVVSRHFNVDGNTGNLAAHPRLEPDRQYKVRFHITSTQQAALNAPLWLQVRSIKFAWSQKLELGGPYAAGTANNLIAQQTLPGVGCQNPDRNGTENGGWYTVIMNTPLSLDIRPEFPSGTPLEQRMPHIASEGGPGLSVSSRRDIRLGATLVDTLDFTANGVLEKGNYTIDRIEMRGFCLVQD